MENAPPVDSLSNEELAAHLRTQHALVPRDIEDRDRMLALHGSAGPAAVVHDHDAPAQPAPSAWRGQVRLSGPAMNAALSSPSFLLIELDDAAGAPPVGSVVTVLLGDGLRG